MLNEVRQEPEEGNSNKIPCHHDSDNFNYICWAQSANHLPLPGLTLHWIKVIDLCLAMSDRYPGLALLTS